MAFTYHTACFVVAFGFAIKNFGSEVVLESCLNVCTWPHCRQGSISHSIVLLLSIFCALFYINFLKGSFSCFIPITVKRWNHYWTSSASGIGNSNKHWWHPFTFHRLPVIQEIYCNFECGSNTRSICLSVTLIIMLSFSTLPLPIINRSGDSYHCSRMWLVSYLYPEHTA